MPKYNEKYTNPLTDSEFLEGMKKGEFLKVPQHVGFVAFLHYTAVRKGEALKMTRGQFRITNDMLFCDIGVRLKHSKRTEPLPLPLSAPYVDSIEDCLIGLKPDQRVWPFCSKTGYNIVHRVFKYPHYHRLSRITNFLLEGWTVPEVLWWTGLTVKALESYVGKVAILKMGQSLARKKFMLKGE